VTLTTIITVADATRISRSFGFALAPADLRIWGAALSALME
jgi:hypothetical protein